MSQTSSYKDVLMKNPDKPFENLKKVNIFEYSRKIIGKYCTMGDLEQLKKVPLKQFSEETKIFLLKSMKEKILEIEIWKCEDINQLSCKLEEFDLRIDNISLCIKYVESIF